MDRYSALVAAYSEAVIELKDARGTELEQRRRHADVLRVVAQQANTDLEEHERKHGCVRKPLASVEVGTGREKTGY